MAISTVSAIRKSPPQRTGFRSDIQGLRAIAVLLVVVYHSGVEVVSGGYIGVDVFFVISGFLITTHLLESLQQHGTVHFASFYTRRARRILPAAFTVLMLTVIAAVIWMPPLLLREVFRGAIATALYVPNMLFGMQGTNYLAESAPSVFQHYWSLGIEEQFYIVWPAILLIGYRLCKQSERALFYGVATLIALSFLLCVIMMSVSQPWAFFSLPTRAWELGVGGLVAFVMRSGASWITHPRMGLMAWVGLGALLVVAVTYGAATPFPSYYAAIPVLATALVIIGGMAGPVNPARVLSVRPMQFVGLISYSLYLVHWPLLVIPQATAGHHNPLPASVLLGLGALSIPAAYVLYRWVENPLRRPRGDRAERPARTLLTVGATSGLILAMTAGTMFVAQRLPLNTGRQAAPAAIEVAPTGTGFVPSNLIPTLRSAADDNPAIYDNGCHRDFNSTDASGCQYGDNDDAPMVVLFGDSHAATWFPALHALAEEGRIRLDVNTKSSCHSVDAPKLRDGVPYTECDTWRDGVIDRLKRDAPAVVLLANYGVSSLQGENGNFERLWAEGLSKTIDALSSTSEVAVLADVPDMGETPAICLSANLEDAHACERPRAEVLNTAVAEVERSAASAGGAAYVDLTDYLCGTSYCPIIIGNELVYRDAHHLTATFSASLAAPLAQSLLPDPQ